MSINTVLNSRWNFRHRAMNWQQAVHMASQPLISDQKVDAYYPLHIIDSLRQNCGKFTISEGVMIVYARPEHEVTSNQGEASLLKCHQPVVMPDGREVSLIIMIAADEQENLITVYEQIQEWLLARNCQEKLIQSANARVLAHRIGNTLSLH